MNTELTIGYVDADNYKANDSFVLKGQLSAEQYKTMRENSEFFVAHELGLPNPALQFEGFDGFPNEDIDHGCNSIVELRYDYGFIEAHCFTDKEPTLQMSVDDFVKAYVKSDKCFVTEFERIKQLVA